MKKLTAAQQKIMDQLHETVNAAKAYEDFESYYNGCVGPRCNCDYTTVEKAIANGGPHYLDSCRSYWEDRKYRDTAIIFANTRSIEALVKAGQIEVVKIGGVEADRVKVLK